MKITVFVVLLLSLVLAIQCRSKDGKVADAAPAITEKQLDSLNDYKLINELFDDEPDSTALGIAAVDQEGPIYYGSRIKYEEIKPCLDEYKRVMAEHGILEDLTTPITTLPKALKITFAEIFRGKELKDFIRQAARLRHSLFSSNKKLAVRAEFGIYTKDFAGTRDPSRIGRIGVFLVTHTFKVDEKGKWIDDKVDSLAFDFGGIHP